MSRALIATQVFLLMCAPLPQASYVAVGLGREGGLELLQLLLIYAASDVLALGLLVLVVRRLPLPERLRLLVERGAARAEAHSAGRATLPAFFVAGVASLYSVALLAGMRRARALPSLAAGLAGDLSQFTSTVLLGGALARLLPVPGGEWLFLLGAPLLVGGATLAPVGLRRVRRIAGTTPLAACLDGTIRCRSAAYVLDSTSSGAAF